MKKTGKAAMMRMAGMALLVGVGAGVGGGCGYAERADHMPIPPTTLETDMRDHNCYVLYEGNDLGLEVMIQDYGPVDYQGDSNAWVAQETGEVIGYSEYEDEDILNQPCW